MKAWLSVLASILVTLAASFFRADAADSGLWSLPEKNFDFDATMLPDGRLFEVPKSARAEARQRLRATSAIEIAAEEVTVFTGMRVRPPAGTRPYLVRAVRFTDRTHGFTVYLRRDGSLRTICGAMGRGPARVEN
ncbi:hypothetical protein HU147_19045, partial [Planomicrobium chinense]|uniref:hypothetical protein n=1 Tax=Planococcus chinensis TaxID=272917 RepID=UPI001CC66BA1